MRKSLKKAAARIMTAGLVLTMGMSVPVFAGTSTSTKTNTSAQMSAKEKTSSDGTGSKDTKTATKDKTSTNSDSVASNVETVKLVDVHELDSNHVEKVANGITDSYGNEYSGNILKFVSYEGGSITYDLKGAYTKFEGNIVCSTDTNSDASMSVGIYADGNLIYSLTQYTRQQEAEPVELDLTGVNTLTIKTCDDANVMNSSIYFVDTVLSKTDKTSIKQDTAYLSELVEIDAKRCETSENLWTDIFGDVHNGQAKFNACDENYILYNLNKKYVSFSCNFVSGEYTDEDASMNVEVYLDDQLVFSQEGITKYTEPVNVNLDVTDGKVLKVQTSRNVKGEDSYLCLTDGIVKGHEHTPATDWTVQKKATTTTEGLQVKKCTQCNEVVESEAIPATGRSK